MKPRKPRKTYVVYNNKGFYMEVDGYLEVVKVFKISKPTVFRRLKDGLWFKTEKYGNCRIKRQEKD